MEWLIYAMLAPFLFAIVNIFDKLLRNKHLSTFTFSVIVGLGGFWVLALIPFAGFPTSLAVIMLGLAAGALFFLCAFPYFQALSIEEASRVVPLWAFEAPLVLVMAFAFLNERLILNDYIGFVLVVVGAFLILTRKVGDVLKPGKVFFLMLLASSFTATSVVISKWLYTQEQFWPIQIVLGIGNGLAALVILLVFSKRRKEFIHEASGLKKAIFSQLALRELAVSAGFVFFGLAIMAGSPSLSTALVQLSALYVLIFAVLLSRFLPHILEEAIDRKTLLTKATAILMIIAGVFAINM